MSDNTFSTLNTLIDQLISQNQRLKDEKLTLEKELATTKDELETLQLEMMEIEESQQTQQHSLDALVTKLHQAAS